MPPKKKVKKTTIFSDEETSEVEDTTAEAPNILEAQKREKAFFDEHKEEKGDELLRNYIEFAKNDKYYKTIFGLDKDGNLLPTDAYHSELFRKWLNQNYDQLSAMRNDK